MMAETVVRIPIHHNGKRAGWQYFFLIKESSGETMLKES